MSTISIIIACVSVWFVGACAVAYLTGRLDENNDDGETFFVIVCWPIVVALLLLWACMLAVASPFIGLIKLGEWMRDRSKRKLAARAPTDRTTGGKRQ